jgi:fibro-slime domain-containing protein
MAISHKRLFVYGLLGGLLGAAIVVPATQRLKSSRAEEGGEEPPAEVQLMGVARDFQGSHPDFAVVPPLGLGHDAGVALLELSEERRPVFSDDGRRVLVPATDAVGRHVAPHRVTEAIPGTESTPGVIVNGLVSNNNSSRLDSYASVLGPYGGGNVFDDAIVVTNSTAKSMLRVLNTSDLLGSVMVGPGGDPDVVIETSPNSGITGERGVLTEAHAMPTLVEPGPLPPNSGELKVSEGTTTVTTDLHLDELKIDADGEVVIDGDVIILCEHECSIAGRGLRLTDGSTLELWSKGDFKCTGPCNVDGRPSRLQLYHLGTSPVEVLGVTADLAAQVYAPNATLTVRQKSEFYGTFVGESLDLDNNGQAHIDHVHYVCGSVLGTPASLGPDVSNGGVSSASSFDQWFHDLPGTNVSVGVPITLVRQPDGIYVFDDQTASVFSGLGGFYPIDDRMFGNEGPDGHNNYFTFAFKAKFTYDLAAAQWFKVLSDADVRVFIDDENYIDLGGVHGELEQRCDLAGMCLIDGEVYTLSFFFAHRRAGGARLRIETNIVFQPHAVFSITAQYD